MWDPPAIPTQDPVEVVDETLNHLCGWCGQSAWFRLRAAAWAGFHSIPTGRGLDYFPRLAAIYQCGGCQNASLLVWITYASSSRAGRRLGRLEHTWPSGRALEMEDLPHAEVQADRLEAWNCFLQDQHRAAVLMARSALQRAVRALLAHEDGTVDEADKGTLFSELNLLVERAVITAQLRANADEVRISGNDAAHPEELGAVSREDAEDSLRFLDDFLETTMAVPARQRARRERRESEK